MRAEVRRIAGVSSTPRDFVTGRKTFVQRLRKFGVPLSLVKQVLHYDPYLQQLIQTSNRHDGSMRPVRTAQSGEVLRLILPYHKVWEEAALSKLLTGAVNDPFWRDALQQAGMPADEQAQVSWKLGGPHL